ncbi:MAG: flagellar assembly protein FliW [Thermodesulfovibrionales bacterium]|nr:flagellar assembly protein FliW [Thermodesulfovibrionales bacterium]
MIRFVTSRFGVLEVSENEIIHFPQGIPGFVELKRYVLMDYKDTPLKWLQAVDDPDVAFIVVDPSFLNPDYAVCLDENIRDFLDLKDDNDLAVLVIIRREGDKIVANFNGPLLFNASNRRGMQACFDYVPFSNT